MYKLLLLLVVPLLALVGCSDGDSRVDEKTFIAVHEECVRAGKETHVLESRHSMNTNFKIYAAACGEEKTDD